MATDVTVVHGAFAKGTQAPSTIISGFSLDVTETVSRRL